MTSVDEIEKHYWELMRGRLFQEAYDLLAQAREAARKEGEAAQASYFGSLQASALIASGRDEDALAALYQAREDNPTDPFLRLRIATFLVTVLQCPAEALKEIAPAIETLLAQPETRHAALGIMGAAHLALRQTDEAKDFFREMLQSKDLKRMDPASFDFVLVKALISQGELAEECTQYLEVILDRALSEGDEVMINRARALLQKARK